MATSRACTVPAYVATGCDIMWTFFCCAACAGFVAVTRAKARPFAHHVTVDATVVTVEQQQPTMMALDFKQRQVDIFFLRSAAAPHGSSLQLQHWLVGKVGGREGTAT